MRNLIILSLFAGLFFLASCSVEKRHYRKGFYVSAFSKKHSPKNSVSHWVSSVSAENKGAEAFSCPDSAEKKSGSIHLFSAKEFPVTEEFSEEKKEEKTMPVSPEKNVTVEKTEKPPLKKKISIHTDFTLYVLLVMLLCAWLFRKFGAVLLVQEPLNYGAILLFVFTVVFVVALPLQLVFLGIGLVRAIRHPDLYNVWLTVLLTLIGLALTVLFVMELILCWQILFPFAFIRGVHIFLLAAWLLFVLLGMFTIKKLDLIEEDGLYFGKKNKV